MSAQAEPDFASPIVDKKSLERRPEIVRTRLLGGILAWIAVMGIPMAIVLAFASMGLASKGAANWQIESIVAAAAVLTAGLIWLGAVGTASYGVSLTEEGVVVSDKSVKPGKLTARTLTWDSLREPVLTQNRIYIHASLPGTYLQPAQAVAVLTDPRCRIRNELPANVTAWLRKKTSTK